MTNMITPASPSPDSMASRPQSSQTGATRNRPAPAPKGNSSLNWKSVILSAGVGVTLLGSTLLTRIEQANAAAEVARSTQASAVVQVVQALEFAQSTRSAQLAAQAANANQPRTIIVQVPVALSGGQAVVNQVGGQAGDQGGGQSNNQQVAQFNNQQAASAPAPAFVMPPMPVAPTFQAPVAVTKAS